MIKIDLKRFSISNNLPFILIAGPCVIENEIKTLKIAEEINNICRDLKINYIFKSSFDKANRSSIKSQRGVSLDQSLKIFEKVKNNFNCPITTDVHTENQCNNLMKDDIIDILQIPAFLCRQTDLIEAAAKTNKVIHVKKGQFSNAQSMIKVVDKFRKFGHTNKIILCERGNMYGYNDLIVDSRNLVWMKSEENLVSMDITHCLQQPSITHADGTVKSGGLREFIPLMGKIALVAGVDAIFMEVHNNVEEAKCDGPTQWPLDKLESLLVEFLKFIN